MRIGFAVVIAVAMSGCRPQASSSSSANPSPTGTPRPLRPDGGLEVALKQAAIGVDDGHLAALLREHWEHQLREHPVFATQQGVHAWDDQLGDNSAQAIARRREVRDEFARRLDALLEEDLSERDRVTAELLHWRLRSDARQDVCRFEHWNVSARNNPLERASELPRKPRTQAEADGLVQRYRQIPQQVDDEIDLLRVGAADGLFATEESLRRVVEMYDAQLQAPLSSWALLEIDPSPGIGIEAEAVVRDDVKPAIARYRDFVRDELLPHGRPASKSGLVALGQGSECYAAAIERHTSLPLTAEEVHELGLEEIARLDVEIAELGASALGTKGLAATLERLRSDRSLYFDTPQAVHEAAAVSLAAAKAAMKDYFGRLPRADCVVEDVPGFKAPFTTIAYYDPPYVDGSKPGEYFINVLDPQTRPRFEARVLAVHESIPGHHLQIAISQELGELPSSRRHFSSTVFVEGWALYTERLAEEMGLYENDLDRMGMLSFDAWRAGRLVVDTGIHALGWSREQAETFLLEHTALTPKNIENEVDRYIAWPGQALGYKVGQLEIWKLRREAEAALGPAFDLPSFHDAVLGGGAVTIPALRARIAKYVDERRGGR